jgi:L-amino acid N-acyltransferase YncA
MKFLFDLSMPDEIINIRNATLDGFAKVAHFKEIGFKFGRWLDLKFIKLILTHF